MYKVFSKISSVLVAAALTAVLLPACSHKSATAVSFVELVSYPGTYDGKLVSVEGFYFDGFEITAFCASLDKSNTGRYVPRGVLIWLSGALPQAVRDGLFTQTDTPSGYAEHFAKIRLTGIFEYGGAYGHLDAYKYHIRITDAEYLNWTLS